MNLPLVHDIEVVYPMTILGFAHGKSLDSNNHSFGQESSAAKLDFNEVWNRTSDTNTTVYFGNCGEVNEDLVRSLFEPYGPIVEVRPFKEKGYAFIR